MNKILIIEDDLDLLEELQDLLLYENYQVVAAQNAEKAWEMLKLHQPDLVLSGIKMPGVDGLEWLKKLRSQPEYALLPFIFLTGLSTFQESRQAMDSGADDYLVKPVRAKDLLNSIQTRLKRYHLMRQQYQMGHLMQRQLMLHHFPHELLTPLSALIGTAKVLQKQCHQLPPARLSEMADVMLRNGQRLNQLLQNQLMYLELTSDQLDGEILQRVKESGPLKLEPYVISMAKDRAAYYERENDLQLKTMPAEVMAGTASTGDPA